MRNTKLVISTLAALAVSAAIFGPGTPNSAEAQDLSISSDTEVYVGPEFIDIQTANTFNSAELRIAGPKGYALTLNVPKSGSFVTADLLLEAKSPHFQHSADGQASAQLLEKLPDGIYTYELITFSGDGVQQRVTGQFHVDGGTAIEKRSLDGADLETDEGLSQNAQPGIIQRVAGNLLDFLVPSAHADTFAEVATNELCVNDGCTEPESFPVIDSWIAKSKMKRTAPSRLLFEVDDPDWHDWAIVPNAGISTDPQNYFAIKNVSLGNDPFRIDGNAPEDSLRILDSGNVGLGLAAPQARLHIRNSGSSFFPTPNTLLFTTSFFNAISGTTTTRDFRVQHFTTGLFFYNDNGRAGGFAYNAPVNSLEVTANGVGMGTNNPTHKLHVTGDDAGTGNSQNVQVLVQNTSGTAAPRNLFRLINNGNVGFQFINTEAANWTFAARSEGDFMFNRVGSGQVEFRVTDGGDVYTSGSVNPSSSRALKQDIADLNGQELLTKLDELPVHEWSYIKDPDSRHIGPMAEDFYDVFGLGTSNKHISTTDMAGIALGAVKALKQENEALRKEISELGALQERIASLESVLMPDANTAITKSE
ncbi:tail fiber domain-containing protein [Wenzhouxiangella sp. XN201]|uniref:tail fiber domain-containing protein n=1 Tax=Wenzhouxiangella sp. XN201 TaxID=2710755 RepID=UPI0013C8C7F1|nr:tail fiber domain-containing protein [Wenzhouxiangella sp. XN201]NEZ04104.1 tail fiber domain-containing protein [Wenzhouxiangella sp. XN201]